MCREGGGPAAGHSKDRSVAAWAEAEHWPRQW